MSQTHKKQLLAQAAFHRKESNPTQPTQPKLMFSDKSFVENFFFDCSIFNVDGPVGCLCKCRVMGYHNNSSLVLLRKNAEKVKDFISSLCVQIASWLVCKNYCGVVHQCSGYCNPLLLTST